MPTTGGFSDSTADVAVVGNGLIGRACALAIANRGARVALIGEDRAGRASAAAAGMLAPSVERSDGAAHDFAIAARDRYPSYVEWLGAETGIHVPLNRRGVLQVALGARGERGLRRSMKSPATWLDRQQLLDIEPAFGHALGAVHSPDDGAVDNVALLAALDAAIAACALIQIREGSATEIKTGESGARVVLADGGSCEAGHVVLAAGAWSAQVKGFRFAWAVTPMRGQLLSWPATPTSHVIYGPRGYLVPRESSTIAGSTMETVGFDSETTPEGLARIRSIANEILPGLAGAGAGSEPQAWAGLRPVTPDLLPLLGPDPADPRIIYATGHSRNGILMAPLTADCIAAMIFEDSLNYDLSQFRPDRF